MDAILLAPVLAAALAAQGAPPGTDIFLADLQTLGSRVEVGAPVNVTHRPGYDNQPFFLPQGGGFLYTAVVDGQSDIFRHDLATGRRTRITATPESEYSPTPLPDGSGFSAVRVEADSTQRLWRFDWDGSHPALVLPGVKPVGYHAWGGSNVHSVALFVLGQPATLQIADTRSGTATPAARDIGRGLQRVPGRPAVISFVQKGADSSWSVAEIDLSTRQVRVLVPTLKGVDLYAWTPDGLLLMAQGTKLYQWNPARSADWAEVADFASAGLRNITRLAVSPGGDHLALVAADPAP
jgi:WD40 repeat protein